MPLPSGVTTCDVVFNTPNGFGGGSGTAVLTVRPSQTIFWAATGKPLGAFTETMTASGSSGTMPLPHVDQPGFVDSAGNAITNWHYKGHVMWAANGETLVSKRTFQVLTGQTTVIFDLIPDGSDSAETVAAAVPAVISVNGQAGAVTGLSTVTQALLDAARDPESLFTGTITRDANGAPTASSVIWPDGVTGTYAGTASATWPGAVDSYTITHGSTTYTQPLVTRNASGAITTRPAITV